MSDLISRQAAIDVINHELRCGAVIDRCGLETAHDLIEELPSAQPEEHTEKRTETHACDCISRQEAMEDIDDDRK